MQKKCFSGKYKNETEFKKGEKKTGDDTQKKAEKKRVW
jgi:hypothetical protein